MALTKLKSLFQKNLEKNETNEQDNQSINITEEPVFISYDLWGFQRAAGFKGSPHQILLALIGVKEQYKDKVRKNSSKQAELKAPIQANFDTKCEEIKHEEEELAKIREDKIPHLKDKIDGLNKDIININNNPSSIGADRMSKVSFWIGLLILLALTIYLFVFYSSATYSAFFGDVSKISTAIFDAQALAKASKGLQSLLLVSTMPFVFLGLGFLIHKFQEQKGYSKYLKIGLLILITFMFDCIIAYEISAKFYNENKSLVDPTYDIPMAIGQVEFWMIIFAGFVVYLIWGFVFDFTMDSYGKIDVVNQAIKTKETEIIIHEKQLEELNTEINEHRINIKNLRQKCIGLQSEINGVIIPLAELGKLLNEFLGGWLRFMHQNQMPENIINEVNQKADEFITTTTS